MKEQQENQIVLFCCPYNNCIKEYKSKFNLKRHVQYKHLACKPFNCTTCKRSFFSKQNLFEHHFIHTGEKPYSCDVCFMRFRQVSLLSLHRRKHSSNYEKTLKIALEIQEHEKANRL